MAAVAEQLRVRFGEPLPQTEGTGLLALAVAAALDRLMEMAALVAAALVAAAAGGLEMVTLEQQTAAAVAVVFLTVAAGKLLAVAAEAVAPLAALLEARAEALAALVVGHSVA